MLELSRKREAVADLAPVLWHSFGTVVALIQEIVRVYPLLSPPPTLTQPAANRVCNSLALMQCVASHPETRPLFLRAHIPLLLYPFLNTVSKDSRRRGQVLASSCVLLWGAVAFLAQVL